MRKQLPILIVLFGGVLMAAIDIAILGPALVPIQNEFHVTERALPWIFNIYVLFNLLGNPFMAKLSDIYGRKPLYLINLGLFAAGSLLVATASSFPILLIGRAIQGLGGGGILPVAAAVIGDAVPKEKQGTALGLIGAMWGLAFIIGPILGGVLLLAGWRWIFIVNLPIIIVIFLGATRFLLSSPRKQSPRLDWVGMLLLALMLLCSAYGLNQLDADQLAASFSRWDVFPFFILPILVLPVFLWVQKKVRHPIIPLIWFRSRQVVIGNMMAFGLGIGEASLIFIPALVVTVFHLEPSTASFLLLPAVAAVTIGAPIAGKLLDRIGSKQVILGGTSCFTLGMILLSFFCQDWSGFIIASIITGFGISAVLGAPLRYIMLNEVSESNRGVAQSFINIFNSIGKLFCASIIGAVISSHNATVWGYQIAYFIVGIVGASIFALAFGLKSRKREQSDLQQMKQQSPIP
jgi:MFS family permease